MPPDCLRPELYPKSGYSNSLPRKFQDSSVNSNRAGTPESDIISRGNDFGTWHLPPCVPTISRPPIRQFASSHPRGGDNKLRSAHASLNKNARSHECSNLQPKQFHLPEHPLFSQVNRAASNCRSVFEMVEFVLTPQPCAGSNPLVSHCSNLSSR